MLDARQTELNRRRQRFQSGVDEYLQEL